MEFVQVGESHVDRHQRNHAASAEADGPGSSCLQRRLIATSGNENFTHTHTLAVGTQNNLPTVVKGSVSEDD